MSNSAKGRGVGQTGPSGFRMVEMLVVVCILPLFAAIIAIAPSVFSVRKGPRENPTRLDLDCILSSVSRYRLEFDTYPPGTGTVELATGTTKPFAPGEIAGADAICKYLGKRVARPESIKTVNGLQIMVDRWGNPYRLDFVKDSADPQRMRARVWSLGPDGKEGPVPFSRVQAITDPRDADNIVSWVRD